MHSAAKKTDLWNSYYEIFGDAFIILTVETPGCPCLRRVVVGISVWEGCSLGLTLVPKEAPGAAITALPRPCFLWQSYPHKTDKWRSVPVLVFFLARSRYTCFLISFLLSRSGPRAASRRISTLTVGPSSTILCSSYVPSKYVNSSVEMLLDGFFHGQENDGRDPWYLYDFFDTVTDAVIVRQRTNKRAFWS